MEGPGVSERARITAGDLEKLPLRAIVAFANRCARRVLPLFDLSAENGVAAATYAEAAIRMAGMYARGVDNAGASAGSLLTPLTFAALEDTAALPAANAASAAGAASVADAHKVSAEAAMAADETCNLAGAIGGEALAADYLRLLELKLGNFPDPGKPIDPSEVGPLGSLWPAAPPVWYPGAVGRLSAALQGRVEGNPELGSLR